MVVRSVEKTRVGSPSDESSHLPSDQDHLSLGEGLTARIWSTVKSVFSSSLQLLVRLAPLASGIQPHRYSHLPFSAETTTLLALSSLSLAPRASAEPTYLEFLGGDPTEQVLIEALPEGGFLVASDTLFSPFLAECQEDGTVSWARLLKPKGNDLSTSAGSLKLTSDGKVALVMHDPDHAVLLMLDRQGEKLWAKQASGYFRGIASTTDGGVVCLGNTNSLGDGYRTSYLVKVNSAGAAEWTRVLSQGSSNGIVTMISLTDHSIITLAHDCDSGPCTLSFAKHGPDGTPLWRSNFQDSHFSIAPMPNGGFASLDRVFSTMTSFSITEWSADGLPISRRIATFDLSGTTNGPSSPHFVISDTGHFIFTATMELNSVNFVGLVFTGELEGTELVGQAFMNGTTSIETMDIATYPNGEILLGSRTFTDSGNGLPVVVRADQTGHVKGCRYLQPIATTLSNASNMTSPTPVNTTEILYDPNITDFQIITQVTTLSAHKYCPQNSVDSPSSSPPSSPSQLPLIIGLAAGGTVLVLGGVLGAVGIGIWRRNRAKVDLSSTPTRQGKEEKMQPNEMAPVTPPPPLSDRREFGDILAKKYQLYRKITREEAAELAQKTGIYITFVPEQNKAKTTFGNDHLGKIGIAREISGDKNFLLVRKIKDPASIAKANQEALPPGLQILDSITINQVGGGKTLYQIMPISALNLLSIAQSGVISTPSLQQGGVQPHFYVNDPNPNAKDPTHHPYENVTKGPVPHSYVNDADGSKPHSYVNDTEGPKPHSYVNEQ